jgi:hypothetical protein
MRGFAGISQLIYVARADIFRVPHNSDRVNDMLVSLQNSLNKLVGSAITVAPGNGFPEAGSASTLLRFQNETWLQAEYWRLIENGRHRLSTFDHQQQYGLPSPIDAIHELREKLAGKIVQAARHDQTTGDLLFDLTNETKLQILNFTGYEIWEIRFPDGTGEYSNYAT